MKRRVELDFKIKGSLHIISISIAKQDGENPEYQNRIAGFSLHWSDVIRHWSDVISHNHITAF